MSQTFTCETGIMSFYWSWITDEKDSMYDDFFLVRLDGTIILSGSQEDSSLSPFPNVPDDDVDYDGPGGLDFSQGRSNFVLFSIPISAGTHTIEFLVADNADPIFESGLMIDGITVTRVYEMPPRESVAVGGYYMPVDRLTILAPYLTLASLIGIVISVLLTRKRRKN